MGFKDLPYFIFWDLIKYPPVIKHGLLENTTIYSWFSNLETPISSRCPIAMLDYRRVVLEIELFEYILSKKEIGKHIGDWSLSHAEVVRIGTY